MVKIILERHPDDERWYYWIDSNELDDIAANGKTHIQNIKDDIVLNSDKTGWGKYRKALLDIGRISEEEHDKWTITPAITPT